MDGVHARINFYSPEDLSLKKRASGALRREATTVAPHSGWGEARRGESFKRSEACASARFSLRREATEARALLILIGKWSYRTKRRTFDH